MASKYVKVMQIMGNSKRGFREVFKVTEKEALALIKSGEVILVPQENQNKQEKTNI